MATKMIVGLESQLKEIIFNNKLSIVWKHKWFSIFREGSMPLKEISYQHFGPEYYKAKIISLTAIEDDFFDFRFHYELKVTSKDFEGEKSFDPKVDVRVFGNNHLSALWRLVEARCQNNEAPVESVIGVFANQTFRNQSEETGEDRAIIKVNGDDSIIGLMKTSKLIAQFSADGIPAWDMKRLNLPITYGRYKKNTLAKVVLNQTSKVAIKQNYMYHCSNGNFSQQQNDIALRFTPLELVDEVQDDDQN